MKDGELEDGDVILVVDQRGKATQIIPSNDSFVLHTDQKYLCMFGLALKMKDPEVSALLRELYIKVMGEQGQ